MTRAHLLALVVLGSGCGQVPELYFEDADSGEGGGGEVGRSDNPNGIGVAGTTGAAPGEDVDASALPGAIRDASTSAPPDATTKPPTDAGSDAGSTPPSPARDAAPAPRDAAPPPPPPPPDASTPDAALRTGCPSVVPAGAAMCCGDRACFDPTGGGCDCDACASALCKGDDICCVDKHERIKCKSNVNACH